MLGQFIFVAALWTANLAVPDEIEQLGAINRLVEAIHGSRSFEEADFIRSLSAADKEGLMVLSSCKYIGVTPTYRTKANKPNVLIPVADNFLLTWDCRGFAKGMGPQLKLKFVGARIAKIETFDLHKVKKR